MMRNCYICRAAIPDGVGEEHHKIPQRAGGSDDSNNLVWLHSGCHQDMHKVAKKIQHGKAAQAQDLAHQIYRSVGNGAIKRCIELASHAADAFLMFEHDDYDDINVSILLPKYIWDTIKLFASEHKGEHGKMGGAEYLRLLVEDHVRKKGYAKDKPEEFREDPSAKYKSLTKFG